MIFQSEIKVCVFVSMSAQQSSPFPGLPVEVKVMILLLLDGRSLHTCRQLSSRWDQFIRREVWPSLERRLSIQWRFAEPTRSSLLEREEGEQIRAVSDGFVVSCQQVAKCGNNILKLRDVRTGECWLLDQLDCYLEGEVAITDSLLIATTTTGGLRCWSLGSRQRILKRDFPVPHIHFKVDQQTNQILFLEEKKRLHFRRFEFDKTKLRIEVQEVCGGKKLKRRDYTLVDFKPPYAVVTTEGISRETHLMKLGDCEGVKKLLTVDGKFSFARIFFPQLILLEYEEDNENGESYPYLKASVLNIESGNCIKHVRHKLGVSPLTAEPNYPITLTSNGSQLALIMTEYTPNVPGYDEEIEDLNDEPEDYFAFQTAITLLDLKSLLEEREPSFRRITVEGINEVFMTKTSVMVSQTEDEELSCWSEHYKLNRWNFWNSKE